MHIPNQVSTIRVLEYVRRSIEGRYSRQARLMVLEGILEAARHEGYSIDFWRPFLEQRWLIADHWSAYHDMVATEEGWSIGYVDGMWQVITVDANKFKTNQHAHDHVKMREHEALNRIYAQAIEAVVMGNFKGARAEE